MSMEKTEVPFTFQNMSNPLWESQFCETGMCCTTHRILPRSGCGYTLTNRLFTSHRGGAERSKLGVQRSKTPAGPLTNFISACWELLKVQQCFLGELFFISINYFFFKKKGILKYFHFNQWEIYVKLIKFN